MEEVYSNNRERGFIGIIIMLLTVGLITGGLYYYLQRQIPKIPEITTEGPAEEDITKVKEEVTPSLVPTPTPTPLVQKCTDGTLYSQCSTNEPKYCDEGNLVDKSSSCGCPQDFKVFGDACVSQDTSDIIILEEKTAGEILSPSPQEGTRGYINTLNFLKQFYQTYGDDYDFIVLFPTKPMDNHNSVRITVDTEGTGVEKQGSTDSRYANYTKKLKSIAELNYYYIWEDPWFPKQQTEVDKILVQTMMHEMAHHWCCFISGWPGEGGDYPATTQGIHWPNNLDLFYGDARYLDVMGYGLWIRNNGRDTCVGQSETTQWKFSKLTQYLMGLIPKEQVAPIYLYEPKEDPSRPTCGKYTTINTYIMTVEDIIRANGARIPSHTDSQKNFRVAFVIATPKGENVEQGFIDYVKLYKQVLPDAWEKATDGKSHITF